MASGRRPAPRRAEPALARKPSRTALASVATATAQQTIVNVVAAPVDRSRSATRPAAARPSVSRSGKRRWQPSRARQWPRARGVRCVVAGLATISSAGTQAALRRAAGPDASPDSDVRRLFLNSGMRTPKCLFEPINLGKAEPAAGIRRPPQNYPSGGFFPAEAPRATIARPSDARNWSRRDCA